MRIISKYELYSTSVGTEVPTGTYLVEVADIKKLILYNFQI